LINGAAFAAAVTAANSSVSSPRAVVIPVGSFSFLPAYDDLPFVSHVDIFIEGRLRLWTANITSYPGYPSPWVALSFSNATALRILSANGTGLIDGRGNNWWWYAILVEDFRPPLLVVEDGASIEIRGLTFLNGPRFHVYISGVMGLVVDNCTVRVDIEDQIDALRYIGGGPARRAPESSPADIAAVLVASHHVGPFDESQLSFSINRASLDDENDASLLSARRAAIPRGVLLSEWFDAAWAVTPPVPMIWALNTDGIDVAGSDIIVSRSSVTNFDDSVCVKPSAGYAAVSGGCSRNVTISDIDVTYGVGVSMGSVPPEVGGNCIDGVVAKRLSFQSPLKAIYIKPNPSKKQTAVGGIANILYENVIIRDALWWAIWVGTQQQSEPDGRGTDCSFLFPLGNSTCPADPLVTLANITLRNVTTLRGLFSPGVLMANETNPGVNFLFDGVKALNASSWPLETYFVENIQGVAQGGTAPVPPSFKPDLR
jgi:hypothetical protein